MKAIAVYNIKGGVGKTASAVNLSYMAARSGCRTLVWDLDPQGAASFYFRIKPKLKGGRKKLLSEKRGGLGEHIRGSDFDLLDVVPADFSFRHLDRALDASKKPEERLKRLLEPLADDYDIVILDCAPSISVTSESIFNASDALLVPTIPTPLSMRTLEQLDAHLSRKGPKSLRVLPFMCMVDRRKKLHRMAKEMATASAAEFDHCEPFLQAEIPYSSQVERMGLERTPVTVFSPRSAASRAYAALWHEVVARLGGAGESCRGAKA